MRILVILYCALAVLASGGEEFITANNKFATRLYKQIAKHEPGNFLVSPFSVETVLALTLSGARGETAQEAQAALHLPEDLTQIEEELKTLLPALQQGSNYTLYTVNKLYIKENYTVKEEFQKVATEAYNSSVANVDFLEKKATAQIINSWVEQQTNNKIQNLLNPKFLNKRTRLLVVNALYFKSDWSQPFFLEHTRKIPFHKTPSDTVEVDALHSSWGDRYLYYYCPNLNAKFLELPFQGGEASLTFVLPKEYTDLPTLEGQIEKVLLPHNLTRQLVDVAIPKFRLESDLKHKEVLKNLGVNALFTDFESDLSGIAGKKGDLVVSEVVQKSFIEVSEEGVEAAAAAMIMVGMPLMDMPEPAEFVADHPFLFYIRVKGVVIFVGRVADPTSGG